MKQATAMVKAVDHQVKFANDARDKACEGIEFQGQGEEMETDALRWIPMDPDGPALGLRLLVSRCASMQL